MPTPTPPPPMLLRRKLAWALVALLFCTGVVLVRVLWDGAAALAEGDRAIAAGDTDEAIARWRRAARWYAPGAPHVARAYDRLEALATEAERAAGTVGPTSGKDAGTALAAWTAVRSSALATRWLTIPHADRLARANQRIAALMAAREDGARSIGADPETRRVWHLALLTRDRAPSVPFTLLALAGFALWVGGAALFAWRGLDDEDRLDRRFAALAGVIVAVGLVLWMLGLHFA